MRIAQVTSSLAEPLGGAEQYCVELSLWLATHGHEVTLYGHGADDQLLARCASADVKVMELAVPRPYAPGARSSSALAKLRFHGLDLIESFFPRRAVRAVADGPFDVIHVHRWSGLGAALLRRGRSATAHTVHDYALVDTTATSVREGQPVDRLPLPQRLRARALRAVTAELDLAVFPTARTRDRHLALGAEFDAGRTAVLGHGWRLPPATAGTAARRPGSFSVLYMGKLTEAKGVDRLLTAWKQGVPGARLSLAGAGELETAARSAAADRDDVDYLGWLSKEDQASVMTSTDLLVLPSRWPENFPLVMAEALVAGVPVLATRLNAPDLLRDGVNALVVEDSEQGIRDGLRRLAASPELQARLRAGARTSAEELDFDRHGEKVAALLSQIATRYSDR
ncbi:glycosyltransferase family 4 protein [Amnibacterium soli]|uniref:D-inositol 3-phosphate glycosyltransferase n=1 Tax=Amnibacterium soli TaxID=1282736 RepID=A0ABP8ZDZ1_9MICO